MMWLILIWFISIVFNTVMIVRSMMVDRSRVTGLYLLYYILFGTIFAPILAIVISIGLIISLHHNLKKMKMLNKTIYKFGGGEEKKCDKIVLKINGIKCKKIINGMIAKQPKENIYKRIRLWFKKRRG